MDTAIEDVTGVEKLKRPEKDKSFFFNDAIFELRQGNRSNPDVKKLVEIAPLINKATARPMIEYLKRQEGVSPEFSVKMLSDAKLLKRVSKLASNFAENGERMLSLEEAEIYCDLFESGYDDISGFLQVADLTKKFKHLKPLDERESRECRSKTIPAVIKKYIEDQVFDSETMKMIQMAVNSTGGGDVRDENTWQKITEDPKRLEAFLSHKGISWLYTAMMDDRKIGALGRNVELFWKKENTDSEPVPAIHIERLACNPETGAASKLAFDIEKEYIDLPDGSKKAKRVVKNLEIVIDRAARGTNQGPEFLLSLLPLCKEYGIDEVEFVANMKIGSYAWTRIRDIDALATLQKKAPRERQRLGNGPDDEKIAKSKVMVSYIIPMYERNMAAAISSVLKAIKDPKKKREMEDLLVHQFMEKEYPVLKQRAMAGEATMGEMAGLGEGFDLVHFNDDGIIVQSTDPEATHIGHLGQAAIMGIPWKSRIKTDRVSLFALIDKMHVGKGVASSFTRLAMKVGAFLRAPKAKV